MEVNSIRLKSTRPNFKAARINIGAFGDIHGLEKPLIKMIANIEKNSEDVFIGKNNLSTKNILAIVGDFFFNPSLKGYKSNPNKTAGDFQLKFLNTFIDCIKKIVPDIKTYFVVGNHDLDAGDKFLFRLLKKAKTDVILTNVDFKKSPELTKLNKNPNFKDKFIQEKIVSVIDDKNPKLEHKVLLLGLSPMGLDYYFPKMGKNPGISDGFKVFDRFKHTEKNVRLEEIEKTLNEIDNRIRKFKNKNPNSPVVVLSHTGDKISKMIADRSHPEIILSGHDHINTPNEDYRNSAEAAFTKIISLAQDGQLFKTVQLHFNDTGILDNVRVNTVVSGNDLPIDEKDIQNLTQQIDRLTKGNGTSNVSKNLEKYIRNFLSEKNNGLDTLQDKTLAKTISDQLAKDHKPILKIIPEGFELKKDTVRSSNSPLANTITDILLSEVKEKEPDVQILGIASSAFRRGLTNGSTNSDLLNVLSGSIESQSIVQTGNIKGEDLAEIIAETCLKNNLLGDKFPMMQWSRVQINKSKIIELFKLNRAGDLKLVSEENYIKETISKHSDEIKQYIKIKTNDGSYEPLNLSNKYKVALPNKCFMRSEIESMKKHGKNFSDDMQKRKTLNDLLFNYLNKNDYKIKISDDTRIF